MSKRKVTIILYPDENSYVAFVPLLPSCTTQGDSPEDALRMAKESIELMLEDATDDDMEALESSWVPHVVVGEVEVNVPESTDERAKKAPIKARA